MRKLETQQAQPQAPSQAVQNPVGGVQVVGVGMERKAV